MTWIVAVAALVAELLAQEPEATLLSEADVRWDQLSLGIYERQCVVIRGVHCLSVGNQPLKNRNARHQAHEVVEICSTQKESGNEETHQRKLQHVGVVHELPVTGPARLTFDAHCAGEA